MARTAPSLVILRFGRRPRPLERARILTNCDRSEKPHCSYAYWPSSAGLTRGAIPDGSPVKPGDDAVRDSKELESAGVSPAFLDPKSAPDAFGYGAACPAFCGSLASPLCGSRQ
jgi:hypothetical protein